MEIVFLGLGSNLGDRVQFLEKARELLGENGVQILGESLVYETEPVAEAAEDKDQPWFLNQVLKVETDLEPQKLLAVCEDIEGQLGREEKNTFEGGVRRYFPKTIDIDILLYGEREIDEEDLVVPHPRMKERGFVLVPLVEIAPEYEPLLNACQDSATVRPYEHPTAS